MQINEKLNLVLPLRRDEEGVPVVWGYHTPISQEVFEACFRVLGATKAAMFAKGDSYLARVGPQVASLLLKDEAVKDRADRGMPPSDEEAVALLADLKRLTLVMAPGQNGWEQVPVDVAIARGTIDADDWREAESGLVFFTCLYSICARSAKKITGNGTAALLGGSMTSSAPTEYCAFLQKSMQDATTEQSPA